MYNLQLTQEEMNIIGMLIHSSQNRELIEENIDDGNISTQYSVVLEDMQTRIPDWDMEHDVKPNQSGTESIRQITPLDVEQLPEASLVLTDEQKRFLVTKMYGEDNHNPLEERDFEDMVNEQGTLIEIAKAWNPGYYIEEAQHMIDNLFPGKYDFNC